MPEGTERGAKERQIQNWPGKNVLPNFSMKIKVAPFLFTNHWVSIKINFFLQLAVPLNSLTFISFVGRLESPGSYARTVPNERSLANEDFVISEDESYPVVERIGTDLERPLSPDIGYSFKRRRPGRGEFSVTREKRNTDNIRGVVPFVYFGERFRLFFHFFFSSLWLRRNQCFFWSPVTLTLQCQHWTN